MIFSKWKLFGHYFCNNCGHWFKNGCFLEEQGDKEALLLYGDICPKCGALSCEWYRVFGYYFWKLRKESAHKKWLEKRYKKSEGGRNGSRKEN